jgi:hypothetical protein
VWLPWKFENTTHRFWEKKENQRQFFDWLADEHHIEVKLISREDVESLTI